MAPLSKSSHIIIVGAGVFGLSTALHLSKNGYTNISIFDMQPYLDNAYSTSEGADAASADMNKVMRLSYGNEILYQKLAFDGISTWNEWNASIASSTSLPRGLKSTDKIWNNCGFLRLSNDGKLSDHEKETLKSLEQEGLRETQYVIGDATDEARARKDGFAAKLDPANRRDRGKDLVGVFDATAGFVEASKACTWVLHLLRKAGVRLLLGQQEGSLVSLMKENSRTTGIKTANGQSHMAELVVLAAGGWTPSLFPVVSPLLETTAGSVAYIQLPPRSKAPHLWDKFSPERFPVYSYGGWGKGSGLGGFPRTEDGILKIGYRGTKYTNYASVKDSDGKEYRVSVPRTAYWPRPSEPQITKAAVEAIKSDIREMLPELESLGISGVRNCWYIDSLDNNFVVDYAPGDEGLMICSGGSGHGFKFLPVLGREVVKIIEGEKNDYGKLWQWRTKHQGSRNGLEDGESGDRVFAKQIMAMEQDWKFTKRSKL